MRIGLVSYRCENRNTAFNMRQVELAMQRSAAKADLLCSGEAFNAILRELRSLWEAVVQFAGADRVKVDLGYAAV